MHVHLQQLGSSRGGWWWARLAIVQSSVDRTHIGYWARMCEWLALKAWSGRLWRSQREGQRAPEPRAAALPVDLSQIQPTTAESTTAGVKCLPRAPPNATRRCSRLQVYSTTSDSQWCGVNWVLWSIDMPGFTNKYTTEMKVLELFDFRIFSRKSQRHIHNS